MALEEHHDAFKLIVAVLGIAVVRDSVYYRWLRLPLLLPIVVLALVVQRLHVVTTSSAAALPPSFLEWGLAQLSSLLSSCVVHPAVLVLAQDMLAVMLLYSFIQAIRACRRLSWRQVKAGAGDAVFALVKDLGPIKKKLEEETVKLEASMEHSLRPPGWNGGGQAIKALPSQGVPAQEIITQMKAFCGKEEPKWKEGMVSGAVYGGEEEVVELMGAASTLYGLTNPLHPDLWPSVMKYESEVCAMVTALVNGGDEGVVASLSSGGTESIILAAKTHRDWGREEKGITEPEIVACVSAHAAIYKACDLMKMRLVLVPMDPDTFQVNVKAMEAAITANTVMLYASAPTFAQGVIDPISEISALGVKYGVGVHVDCCLGGFILPFAKKLGLDIPPFDFSLKGVTSMSVDTHKYAYASKGTSVVCYRSKSLRRYQYFCFNNWPGGLYVTPTIAGSRPGALSAACWAAMVHIGEEGYMARAKSILETAQLISEGVKKIPGLCLQGKVQAMIVCVGGINGVNIYDVGDRMTKKGWNLNTLQSPPGLHLCCTLRHVGKAQMFLDDLREVAMTVLAEVKDGKGKKAAGNAAIYGMAATLPAGPINEMLKTYTDCVLKA